MEPGTGPALLYMPLPEAPGALLTRLKIKISSLVPGRLAGYIPTLQ
jgi:hypothetical protein